MCKFVGTLDGEKQEFLFTTETWGNLIQLAFLYGWKPSGLQRIILKDGRVVYKEELSCSADEKEVMIALGIDNAQASKVNHFSHLSISKNGVIAFQEAIASALGDIPDFHCEPLPQIKEEPVEFEKLPLPLKILVEIGGLPKKAHFYAAKEVKRSPNLFEYFSGNRKKSLKDLIEFFYAVGNIKIEY